jgi:carbonic anhydrase/acetyltransferase-like protein (isoleucine patch superfamily)
MRYIRQPNGQIKALETFTLYDGRVISAGTLGGVIDSPRNLSQAGACWIFPGSSVINNAFISGNAVVQGNSVISENARVYGNAVVTDGIVKGCSRVLGDAIIQKSTLSPTLPVIDENACISGSAQIIGNSLVKGNARVQGEAVIRNGGKVLGSARVTGRPVIEGTIKDKAYVSGCSYTDPTSAVQCDARLGGCVRLINTTLDCNAIVYGDAELVNETVEDAGYVTNCPEKQLSDCCPVEEEPIP